MRTPTVERAHPFGSGEQKVYRFENGYGASVVRFPGSYGFEQDLWEMAVVMFTGADDWSFKLTYSTPITEDVEGYLSDDDVEALLDRIEALEPPAPAPVEIA